MRRGLPHRAAWLIPCVVAGVILGGIPPRAWGGEEAREWLEKMNVALSTRNYDGTFFHLSDGRVETMRILHRVRAGRITERLSSLDGSGREFVRNDDELTCYLPDQHLVLVEARHNASLLGSLPKFGSDLEASYRLEARSSARVLGRAARVIVVNPKDEYRFGYRLWLDEKTAMPLKTQLCDARGQVIEQILFARLDMPDSIADAELLPAVRTEGMRWVRQGASGDPLPPALSGYRVSRLPPGFHLTVTGTQTLGGAEVPATHLVYSDGLATVSVFVEAPSESGAEASQPPKPAQGGMPPRGMAVEGLARFGSGFAFSTVVQGHQVTAVGEVPAQTVEFIAHSVKSDGGKPLPAH